MWAGSLLWASSGLQYKDAQPLCDSWLVTRLISSSLSLFFFRLWEAIWAVLVLLKSEILVASLVPVREKWVRVCIPRASCWMPEMIHTASDIPSWGRGVPTHFPKTLPSLETRLSPQQTASPLLLCTTWMASTCQISQQTQWQIGMWIRRISDCQCQLDSLKPSGPMSGEWGTRHAEGQGLSQRPDS